MTERLYRILLEDPKLKARLESPGVKESIIEIPYTDAEELPPATIRAIMRRWVEHPSDVPEGGKFDPSEYVLHPTRQNKQSNIQYMIAIGMSDYAKALSGENPNRLPLFNSNLVFNPIFKDRVVADIQVVIQMPEGFDNPYVLDRIKTSIASLLNELYIRGNSDQQYTKDQLEFILAGPNLAIEVSEMKIPVFRFDVLRIGKRGDPSLVDETTEPGRRVGFIGKKIHE